MPSKQFKGTINIDIRDSTPDWEPFVAPARHRKARPTFWSSFTTTPVWPPGRPSAAASRCRRCKRLADNGPAVLPVAHDRALLADSLLLPDRPQPSPERLCLHRRGRDRLPRQQLPHPDGERVRAPRCCARPAGTPSGSARTTTCPIDEWHMGATKRNWPLARGFDRFYGFLGGETNQWYPDLTEDNHYIDQPYQPEEGYHLSKDLADKAIQLHPRHASSRRRTSPGTCSTAPAPTTPRTTRRRSGPTNTRASSMTATRRTASGSCLA